MHTASPSGDATDQAHIVRLYDRLYAVHPAPVVALNRAVASAEVAGAEAALVDVDALADLLPTYQPWHAARAELLRRLERFDESVAAYDAAIAGTSNPGEREFLLRRRRLAE